MGLKMRYRYKVQGGHVHIRVFAGHGETLAKAGELCLRVSEFSEFCVGIECAGWEAINDTPSTLEEE